MPATPQPRSPASAPATACRRCAAAGPAARRSALRGAGAVRMPARVPRRGRAIARRRSPPAAVRVRPSCAERRIRPAAALGDRTAADPRPPRTMLRRVRDAEDRAMRRGHRRAVRRTGLRARRTRASNPARTGRWRSPPGRGDGRARAPLATASTCRCPARPPTPPPRARSRRGRAAARSEHARVPSEDIRLRIVDHVSHRPTAWASEREIDPHSSLRSVALESARRALDRPW